MTTLVPPPVTGTSTGPDTRSRSLIHLPEPRQFSSGLSRFRQPSRSGSPQRFRSSLPPRPKMDFPLFVGEWPRSWKRNYESYFRVFHLDPELWVDTAAMHFSGPAMLWLENGGFDLSQMEWEHFCSLVCDQFERNEFNSLLRQLFHLRQTDSVSEYTTQFNDLMHSLLAHSSSWDPALFPSHFVDGLKDEIRVVVIVHNPRDMDTAVSLAYLQEEALEISKRREPRRSDGGSGGRSHLRGAMPLPAPPGRPPPPA